MALYLLRLLFERTGGEPRDRSVFGFHVDSAAQPTADDVMTALDSAWASATNWAARIQDSYELDRVQVYDVSAGGPPVDEALVTAGRYPTTGIQGPTEVQVVVTRWTNDALGRPRKQGRLYVGPQGNTAQDRVPASVRSSCLEFSADFHDALQAEGVGDPVVVSRVDGLVIGYPIVRYSVDDAWDTQRRRGLDPTTEDIVDMVPPA